MLLGRIVQPSSAHDAAVSSVCAACRTADLEIVRVLLATNVVAVVDGEGERIGPDSVSRLLVETTTRGQTTSVSVESVNGQSGLAFRRADRVVGIAALSVTHGVVERVWLVLAPAKLHHWTREPSHADIRNPGAVSGLETQLCEPLPPLRVDELHDPQKD